MGRPERARVLDPGRLDVDRDDRVRRHHRAALHHVEPDTSGAEHGHARAGRHRRGVDDGADAGHHGTADQRRAVERHSLVDGDGARLRDDRARGIRGDVAVVVHALAAERHARRPVRQDAAAGLAPLAEIRAPDHAEVAAAAGGRPGEDDVVADLETLGVRPDGLDHARSLVAQHDGHGHARPAAVGRVQTAVTDTARDHADEDLARARRLEVELFHLQRLALLEKNRRAHEGLRRISPRTGCAGRGSGRGDRRPG